jgi:hypothetical protein
MKVGRHTYADLRRRRWPQEGYRLLCWNCNSMTRFGRTCPHEEIELNGLRSAAQDVPADLRG